MKRQKISEERMMELLEIASKLTPQEAGFVLRMSLGWKRDVCPICGKEYIGTKNQKYCSSYCGWLAYRRRKYHERKQAKENSEGGDNPPSDVPPSTTGGDQRCSL